MSTAGDILRTVVTFSTMGDIMINVGDFLSTMGVFSTIGRFMKTMGNILSTMGNILSTIRNIMMHVRGYHAGTVGGVQYRWGCNLLLFEYLHGAEHPMVLMISPTCIMISPTVLVISPTVLNTPKVTDHEHPPSY